MSEAPKTDHCYDGIEEFDNPLPAWWTAIFVLSILFAPLYWVYYQTGVEGRSAIEQYEQASAENTRLQFAEIGELTPDAPTILRFTQQENWLSVGKSVFKSHCVSCHGADGQGQVGPNLTDEHFKNINQIQDIATVVANGAGNGAMPKWSDRLNVNEIVLVSAYVATLRGKNIEGGRVPEGREIAPWPEPPAEEEPVEPEPETAEPEETKA